MAAALKRLRAERSVPPPPAALPQVDESAVAALEQIPALEQKVASAEERAKQATSQLAKERHNVERLRGKLETQETLYVSIRSELDAKKDRLRTQQEELERMRALKAGLVAARAEVEASES